jgi:hypothetical protein
MIGDLSCEEFAAQWGCDPVYDKSPRLPGDGYLFYNFGSEKQERTPEFLTSFAAAIQRTIAGTDNMEDREDLLDLLDHVRELCK